MATSSITKNFIISGKKNVEMFVNAVEASYQDKPEEIPNTDLKITHLQGIENIRRFMAKRNS